MNWSMFNLQTLMLGLFGVVIFFVFRNLGKLTKNQSGVIIYVMGGICLAISLYAVGLMVIDILVSDYFSIVDNYKDVSMWTMIIIALGTSLLVAILDPVARDLRKGTGKLLKDMLVKESKDYPHRGGTL